MYAIIATGGKQYKVSEGDTIRVEKLGAEADSKFTFDQVLYVDGKVGNPTVEGAKVTATVLKHGKQKKIRVFKYKNKTKSSRVVHGHRQPYTKIVIKSIEVK